MFTLTFIPDVVIPPLGLHVMEDGCIAAPEMCTYVKNKNKSYHIEHEVVRMPLIHIVNCSPEVSLELNQTRCSSVRVLQTLSGFKVHVISVQVLSTTEA